ncbi:hypothetical protein [Brachybacterium sp.]|uniref:hypothetical protein n=1 Tax=Brachybacterium sp. TaxID=1891286 RepID=UPI002ED056C5
MNQPPQIPGPSDPQQQPPQQPGTQHPPLAAGQEWQSAPTTPQQAGQGGQGGRGKGPILVAVGCGLLILVLVLALVGFFGVRALMGDDDSADRPSASQEESPAEGATDPEEAPPEEDPAEEATEQEPAEEETTEEETTEEETTEPEPTEGEVAAGEENAVPAGTVVTLPELEGFEGSLDISIGDVNWDAADWVDEQNSHNPKPTDQGKYIMVKAEVTYHGPDTFTSFAFRPLDYVAEDGTPYEDAGVVTPDTTNTLDLKDGQSGTMHFVFMMPKDTPESGHFVISDRITVDEALVEGQWIEAA